MKKRVAAYGIADSYYKPPKVMRDHKAPTFNVRKELEAQAEVLNKRQGAKRYAFAKIFEDGTFETSFRPADAGDWTMGLVKWFSGTKGYGFVVIANGQGETDVFLHAAVLEECNAGSLQPGDPVSIRYGKTPKGFAAVEIRRAQKGGAQ